MVLFRKTSKQDALKAGVVCLCHGSSHSRCGPAVLAALHHASKLQERIGVETISLQIMRFLSKRVESALLTAITILKNAVGRFVVSAMKSRLPKKFARISVADSHSPRAL